MVVTSNVFSERVTLTQTITTRAGLHAQLAADAFVIALASSVRGW